MIRMIMEFMMLFFCAIGISEVIRFFVLQFVNLKTKGEFSYILLPMKGKCEDAEVKIRAAATSVRWIEKGCAKSVICLDCGLDEESRKICEKTACDYTFVSVITKEKFFNSNLL